MGFTRIKELSRGRRSGDDNQFQRKYTRVFEVVTDGAFVDGLAVLFAPGIPQIGDPYIIPETGYFDSFAEVISRNPSQPDPDIPTLWEVEVQYSTRGADITQTSSGGTVGSLPGTGAGTGGYGDTPTELPPQVEWKFTQQQKPFTKTADVVPQPVVTKAMEPFNQVPTIDEAFLVYQATRAEAVFDAHLADDYINTLNVNAWKGFLPRRARVINISARLAYEKKRPFWWVTYEVAIRYPDWDVEVLHKGTQCIDETGEGITRCVDKAGNPIESLLDADGFQIDPSVDPVYLKFKGYETRDFATLNLP